MRAEVVISSSYEAAWCGLKGLTCRVVLASDGHDMDFIFDDNKALREARRQFAEDVDLQEFVEAYRRLKWTAKKALKDRREAPFAATSGGQVAAARNTTAERGLHAATKNRKR